MFKEVDRPAGKKVIGAKWVLRVAKETLTSITPEYWLRDTGGWRESIESDDENFAPTIRFESFGGPSSFRGMGA